MLAATLYLFQRTAYHRGRRLLRQLRSPRYVIALLVGLLYLGLVFFGHREERAAVVPLELMQAMGTALLLVLVFKWWLLGADRLALAFSPAEIQFLFPAPVGRTALLGYKLARSQLLILLNVAVWSVLLRAGAESGAGRLAHAGSLWLFFSTLALHRLGVALTRASVLEHGVAGLRRAVVPLFILLGIGTLVWLTLRGFEPTGADPLEAIRQLLSTPPLAWALLPFRVPLLPFGAESVADWFPRAGAALALVALHLAWILRADRAFEEAAVEASARRAERVERWRRHGAGGRGSAPVRRRWWSLASSGSPATAIAWKNLTRLARTTSPGLLLLMAVLLFGGIGGGLATSHQNPALLTLAGTLALSWTGVLVIFGPLWVRADLRADLDHLPTLRTWPLAGHVIMMGEVLGSTIALTAAELLLGGGALVALHGTGALPASGPFLAAAFVVAIPTLAMVNLLAVSLQNGAALLFPSWVRVEVRPGGIEATGQQLLTAGLSLILLALLLAGPGLLGAGLGFLLRDRLGPWAILPALPVAALGLGLEAFLFLEWLGSRFERLDPSAA